jgi:hypothetical protein
LLLIIEEDHRRKRKRTTNFIRSSSLIIRHNDLSHISPNIKNARVDTFDENSNEPTPSTYSDDSISHVAMPNDASILGGAINHVYIGALNKIVPRNNQPSETSSKISSELSNKQPSAPSVLSHVVTRQQDYSTTFLRKKIVAMQKYFGGLIKKSKISDLVGNNPKTNQPYDRSTIDRWIKNNNLYGESILHSVKGKKSILTEEVKKTMIADIHLKSLEGNDLSRVGLFKEYYKEKEPLNLRVEAFINDARTDYFDENDGVSKFNTAKWTRMKNIGDVYKGAWKKLVAHEQNISPPTIKICIEDLIPMFINLFENEVRDNQLLNDVSNNILNNIKLSLAK